MNFVTSRLLLLLVLAPGVAVFAAPENTLASGIRIPFFSEGDGYRVATLYMPEVKEGPATVGPFAVAAARQTYLAPVVAEIEIDHLTRDDQPVLSQLAAMVARAPSKPTVVIRTAATELVQIHAARAAQHPNGNLVLKDAVITTVGRDPRRVPFLWIRLGDDADGEPALILEDGDWQAVETFTLSNSL